MLNELLIVISFYSKRNRGNLLNLLTSLEGFEGEVLVVENIDSDAISSLTDIDAEVILNVNRGMNIGAWNRGFLERRDYDTYLFLQDECFLKKDGYVEAILSRFKKNPKLGMLGESLNRKWNHPWETLTNSPLNNYCDDHFIGSGCSRRVDTYLSAMQSWGVDPGETGAHLRSLVWAIRGDVLRQMGGFPIGNNKGECIAAEISVSRRVIQMGLEFDQIDRAPFFYFGHLEWRSDGSSKV
jgi:hypothetical protein